MRPIFAISLFCEDIRQEKSGQDTVVGVFSDNLKVPSFPGMMPKLGIYSRIGFDPDLDPGIMQIFLIFPDRSTQELSTIDPKLIAMARNEAKHISAPVAGIISRTVLSPVKINQAGRFSAIVKIRSEENLCGTLNIQKND